MEKKIYGRIGLVSIILGILVVNLESFLLITGAVVGVSTVVSRTSFWIGLVFILGGFVLVMAKRQSKLVRILGEQIKSGSIKDYTYLQRMAVDLGCLLEPGKGSHKKVYQRNGEALIGKSGRQVEIPGHNENVKKGLYRGVLTDLRNYAKTL